MLRELAGFSASMTLTQVLFVALVRVQDVIIGRTIGTAAVGVYRTAWRTVELIAQGMIMPFSQVSLPTLGRLQDDLPAFRKAYLRIIAVSSALAFPAIIGFAVLAPDAIPLIFGDQWEESARIAQVLGFMAVPFTLNRFAGPALATLGRSALLAKIAGLQLALTVVMTLAAAPYGLLAIAAAYVIRAYLVLPIQMWAFRKYSGLGYGEVLRAIAPALLTSLVMAGALIALDRLVGPALREPSRPPARHGRAGAAVYAPSLVLFARTFVAQQVKDFKRLLPGASGEVFGRGGMTRSDHASAGMREESFGGCRDSRWMRCGSWRRRAIRPGGLSGSPQRRRFGDLGGDHRLLPAPTAGGSRATSVHGLVLRGRPAGLGAGGTDLRARRRKLRRSVAASPGVPGAAAGAIPRSRDHPAAPVDPLRHSARAPRRRDARSPGTASSGSSCGTGVVRLRRGALRLRGRAVPRHGAVPRRARAGGPRRGRVLSASHRQGASGSGARRSAPATPPGSPTGWWSSRLSVEARDGCCVAA